MPKPVKELKIISGGRGINTHIYFDGKEQKNITMLTFKVPADGPAECQMEIFRILDQGETIERVGTWLAFEGVSYEETMQASIKGD